MVFVNYGGGKYWYFKHASWNGKMLLRGSLIHVGPQAQWVGEPLGTPQSSREQSPREASEIIQSAFGFVLLGVWLGDASV